MSLTTADTTKKRSRGRRGLAERCLTLTLPKLSLKPSIASREKGLDYASRATHHGRLALPLTMARGGTLDDRGGTDSANVLDKILAAKNRDVIRSQDGARIDSQSGGDNWKLQLLERQVTGTPVVILLHDKVTSINLKRCENVTDKSIQDIANHFPELTELNLFRCRNLTDSSIKAIAKGCPKLNQLNLSQCSKLTDESIEAIADGCPELKKLNVLNIQSLTDESIEAIAKGCPQLQELDISEIDYLTDASIVAIAKGCPRLTGFNVSHIKRERHSAIKSLAKAGCPQLKELSGLRCKIRTDYDSIFRYENLTDESIKAIATGCPELKELDVSCCKSLTDESVKAIAEGCPGLKHLNVCNVTNLTDDAIQAIAEGCPELIELNAVNIQNLTDESITAIAKGCPELRQLNVLQCFRITDGTIKAIAKGCPKLTELNVRLCYNLTDEAILAIAKGCPQLKALSVSSCYNLTNKSIKAIARGCPQLEQLGVGYNGNLTSESIEAIAKGCPELKELSVSYCPQISDSSIKAIAKGCPKLKELNVTYTFLITDESIKTLAEGCPKLRELNVSYSSRITDESIKALAEGCPELKELNVSHCLITDESIKAIAKGCSRLKELNLSHCRINEENHVHESIEAHEGRFELMTRNLSHCRITDESIEAIAQACPELKELNVAEIENLTDEAIKAIAIGCPKLEELNISGINNLTDESIKAIAKGCSELKELDVSHTLRITDRSIFVIAKGCLELRVLNVSYALRITDESIKAIAEGCPELNALNVSYTVRITDESIRAIGIGCPHLKELNVSYTIGITDESIQAIAQGCPELKELNVSHCLITDESIKAIATGCPELKELYANNVRHLTDESMKAIAKGCPRLKELNLAECKNLTDESIKAIAEGCSMLRCLFASDCSLATLPDDIGDRLPGLRRLDISKNNLTQLPRSIAKAKHLHTLNVDDNPLQSPPREIARHGVEAMKRYFEELEKGAYVSKLLKIVLVGDGEAGKTSLRNALAGRAEPRQAKDDRTIHLDIEKITLSDELDINVYDCGGQEGYVVSQLPYLTGVALYLLVVEARYATGEHLEKKLHRFLVVLQNRVPGAIVLPIVSKVDTVDDGEKRCRWLEDRIKMWLEEMRRALTSGESQFDPLRVQSPALAVSVDDTESIRAVRERILALTKHDPPLLRGVGQVIPVTYMAVLELFGAIAEYGNDEAALQAMRRGDAHALGESTKVSPMGAYRELDMLKALWIAYCDDEMHTQGSLLKSLWNKVQIGGRRKSRDSSKELAGEVFDKAIQLWVAQGVVFIDAGLVVLQPSLITQIVKPLVDHRLKSEGHIEKEVDDFVRRNLPFKNDEYNTLIEALRTFVTSGELSSSQLLPFLWRNTALHMTHYGRVIEMLTTSGIIVPLEHHADEELIYTVVPFRLPREPNEIVLNEVWPKSLGRNEREITLQFKMRSGFPAGLAERFASDIHMLGTSVYCWRSGVVVRNSTRYLALSRQRGASLVLSVRFRAASKDNEIAAWMALCDAQQKLAAQRRRLFPGLCCRELLLCERCCRNQVESPSTILFDAKRKDCVFAPCGHVFRLHVVGECQRSISEQQISERSEELKREYHGIHMYFGGAKISNAQFVGRSGGSVNYREVLQPH